MTTLSKTVKLDAALAVVRDQMGDDMKALKEKYRDTVIQAVDSMTGGNGYGYKEALGDLPSLLESK